MQLGEVSETREEEVPAMSETWEGGVGIRFGGVACCQSLETLDSLVDWAFLADLLVVGAMAGGGQRECVATGADLCTRRCITQKLEIPRRW